ncbi:unnamed protein product [Cyprideis torosa]|uniref:glutathione transferase n=1 Tax=Cyprideis torosa TaxID=163714 RepID=A0A7R8ZIR6_9CRUS|nr:unnamed protein product [Cyprideis torosa]CAG0885298.1 unnamed protein product [Cyprideis torosa]
MAPVLGYWKTSGYVAPIQHLLEYAGEPYDLKWYTVGPPPDLSREMWLKEKFTLGLDFPNLPYYIDGDVKLTQSVAIMRYIARKNNLAGKSEREKQMVDVAELQVTDLRLALANLFYRNWNDEGKKAFLNPDERGTLPAYLKLLNGYLENRKFLAGDQITYPDFLLYECLEWALFAFPNCLDDFLKVKEFHQTMHDLPSMEKFRASDKCISRPITSPYGLNPYDHKARSPDA